LKIGLLPLINNNIARFADARKIRYLNINDDKLADKDGKSLKR